MGGTALDEERCCALLPKDPKTEALFALLICGARVGHGPVIG